jgi:hypothetical protein
MGAGGSSLMRKLIPQPRFPSRLRPTHQVGAKNKRTLDDTLHLASRGARRALTLLGHKFQYFSRDLPELNPASKLAQLHIILSITYVDSVCTMRHRVERSVDFTRSFSILKSRWRKSGRNSCRGSRSLPLSGTDAGSRLRSALSICSRRRGCKLANRSRS